MIQKLAESGASFLLLGYVVWAVVGFLRTLVESNTRACEQLTKTNADLSAALREHQGQRSDDQRVHAEQTILLKMIMDKMAEHNDG